jgi:hypothetical protein
MAMRRRVFLGAISSLVASSKLDAAQLIMRNSPFGPIVRAYVDHPQLIQQQCPALCWAASASMIFASRGHPVDQKRIVERVYGGVICASSGPTQNITAVLQSTWYDDFGQNFQPVVVAGYDYFAGVNAIDNAFIVKELQANSPLLYCNTHHAMVIVSTDYVDTAMGPNVQAVGVLDPFPGSAGYHALAPAEIVPAHMGGQMTYLASIQV